jgi:predicted RNA-binding protein with PIN domain
MPVHLIIDGYNLLGVRGGLRGDVEAQREQLIRDLAGYRQRKGHGVTVVFDGWRSGHPVERAEWREGIVVVYSKQGEQADAVVKRLAEKYGADCAVVSSDHEIGNFARAQGCMVITSGDFETRLQVSGARPAAQKLEADDEELVRRDPKKKGNPKKLPKALRKKASQLKKF